jgi:ribonuclease I
MNCLDSIKSSIYNFYLNYMCYVPRNDYTNNYKDKYYYLSLKKDLNKDAKWTIHGLWPHYSQTEYPTYCNNVDFDINKLEPIIDDLNTYWYSGKEKNEDFWKHEWEKHGSCMFTPMNELTYFKTTLSLYVDATQTDSINKFKLSEIKSLIPIDKNFKIINEDKIIDEND